MVPRHPRHHPWIRHWDTYSKVWIEFLFPVYLIILNLLVVYCTAKSSSRYKICHFFHRMNSNPLPVLATVILLSFVNLLTTASKALSFVLVTYPDGSKKALWLPDGNILYCEGKHVAIFIVGIVVFFLGVLYSLILTAWRLFDNSSFCKCLRCLLCHNLHVFLKLLLFYYHAPYADRFQFWSGFLLLLRIALLVVSIVSTGIGGDPQISVISVIIATSLLMLIRILIREKSLYRRPCIDYSEMAFNFNLITFAVLTLHIADPDNQITLANISVSVTFILFIGILIDCFYTRLFRSLWYRLKQSPKEITIHTPLLESNDDTEQLEYILKFDQYREPLIDHDSSDYSEELASVPFPQRIHDKTNPKTVEAPGDHDEPTLSQNIGGTSTNQPISSTIAEVPIQELDKLNQEMFDSSSSFDLDKERENQEYCIEEDKVVRANQSDLHELSFSVPLETSSEIQENRQQELLSRSYVSSSFPFPNLFETTTSEHAHSIKLNGECDGLSIDHARICVVQPLTVDTVTTLPTISLPRLTHNRLLKYFECAENVASVPFVDPVTILEFDSSGKECTNISHDITLKVPENAIPQGSVIHFEVAVALYGPFKFPESRRPISPILWICPQEDIILQKPIEIVLPHILSNGLTAEDISCYDLKFYKADHTDYITRSNGRLQYNFKPLNGDMQFVCERDQSFGILQTTHCCFLCITAVQNAELSHDMAQKKGYCLSCIECLQSPYANVPPRDIVYFCTSFFLKTCLKVGQLDNV